MDRLLRMCAHTQDTKLKMTSLFIWHIHMREEFSIRKTVYKHTYTGKIKRFLNIHRYIQEQESYLSRCIHHEIKGQIISIYVCTWRARWLIYIHIWWINELSIYACTHKWKMVRLFINIWTYQEGETNYLCTSMHTSEGWMGYLYTYRRVPRKNGWLYYINMCMWKFYPHCWVCYFSLIIMNPLPGVGSSSYVINVAAPYSTHKCFAFIPACHSESVIRLIPLTLLLQPK